MSLLILSPNERTEHFDKSASPVDWLISSEVDGYNSISMIYHYEYTHNPKSHMEELIHVNPITRFFSYSGDCFHINNLGKFLDHEQGLWTKARCH